MSIFSEYKNEYMKSNNLVHLQGIGDCKGIPASELKVGMYLSWNCCPNGYIVVAIRDVSEKFVEVTEKSRDTGQEYTRRLKKDRLVVAEMPKETKNAL